MKALVKGTILHRGEALKGMALLFEETIRGVVPESDLPEGCERLDADGLMVSPGLIDLHIHGYAGEDTSDGSEEGIRRIAVGLLENGVTSFLPTTMTVSWPEIEQAFAAVRTLMPQSREAGFPGSEILGAHAEGPFINPRRKGAQAARDILPPDAKRLMEHRDVVRIVTMAPEMPGGPAFIREVTTSSPIVVSIGHTDATFAQAMDAIAAGASYVTHLFNAMSGLNHREPGVVGAALASPVYTELIADTFHVHPGLFALLAGTKGGRLVLVTDCTRAGGLGDGEYTLGGQPIFVKGIECRLEDGTIAGSVLRLNQAVRNLRDKAGLSDAQAVSHATQSAAGAIGVSDRKGSFEEGRDADIALFDNKWNARATYVRGTMKYRRA